MLSVGLCMGEHWVRAQEEPSAPLQWQKRAVWPGSSLVTGGVGLYQQKFAETSVRAGGVMAVWPIPGPWFTEVGEGGLIWLVWKHIWGEWRLEVNYLYASSHSVW